MRSNTSFPSTTTSPLHIVSLRSMPGCLDQVVHWIHEEWSSFNGRTLQQTKDRFAAELTSVGLPHSLLAMLDGAPVGVATLRQRDAIDWDAGVGPWICNVYVPLEARGRGVARALCEALEHTATQLGHSHLYLACEEEKRTLYERLGYTVYAQNHQLGHLIHLMKQAVRNLPQA